MTITPTILFAFTIAIILLAGFIGYKLGQAMLFHKQRKEMRTIDHKH